MDIRGMAESVTRKRLLIPVQFIARQAAWTQYRPQSGAVRPRRPFAFSIGDDFYGEMLLEETRRAGVKSPAAFVYMVKAHRRIWQLPTRRSNRAGD